MTEFYTMHYMQDSKEKNKGRPRLRLIDNENWTDIQWSNGLDKGQRTMEVIHSYPSPPYGWHKELMKRFE